MRSPCARSPGPRPRHPGTLPLQHDRPLELGDSREHRQQHPPRGRARVHLAAPEVEDAQRHLLALQGRHDPQQVRRRARQPVEPGHDQRVALAHIVQHRSELPALPDRRRLLAEHLRATRCSERRLLRLQPRHLLDRRGSRITDKHLIFLRYLHRNNAIPSP